MNTVIYSTPEFEEQYTYEGNDLGAVWSEQATSFRVWSPTADRVVLNLYESGNAEAEDLLEQIPMEKDVKGTWYINKVGNLDGIYYDFSVTMEEDTKKAGDPYARTTGVNGERAMVLDLKATNPKGWDTDTDPHAGNQMTDAIIYELHIRDLSIDSSSGILQAGKFLGLTESGTKTVSGYATGLDYIKELGITHLHLLPIYDYGSIDEAKSDVPQFNWGYDPVNYNVPEGSYATDAFHGEVRVKEMKQMIYTLHQNGISVIMDVVYNHVHDAGSFCFNRLVPAYFSRIDDAGNYSNGSGCGNDTASERSMVKKYIVDSVCYLADEYHIDGFRFDLVGLLDTETVNAVVEAVHENHPNVIFYGEGWSMATAVTKEGYDMATQYHAAKTPKFAYFNDMMRDGLKGSVFCAYEKGYVTGNAERKGEITDCILGKCNWCPTPMQTINYASCHDNYTLMDRIVLSTPDLSEQERIRCNHLAAAIYMLSQGVPFIHAGEELLRSKVDENRNFVENSYASSDYVNSIKWNVLEQEKYRQSLAYYKGLIKFRKKYADLRYVSAEEVEKYVTLLEVEEENVIVVRIHGSEDLFMVFNPNKKAVKVKIPKGRWNLYINEEKAGIDSLGMITFEETEVAPISAFVLVRQRYFKL